MMYIGAPLEQLEEGTRDKDNEVEKLKMLAACRIELILRGEKLPEPGRRQRRTILWIGVRCTVCGEAHQVWLNAGPETAAQLLVTQNESRKDPRVTTLEMLWDADPGPEEPKTGEAGSSLMTWWTTHTHTQPHGGACKSRRDADP